MAKTKAQKKELSNLEENIQECYAVEQLVSSPGWQILKKYLEGTIEANNRHWLLLPSDDKRLAQLRFEAGRCWAMISLIENFKTERKKLEELWMNLETDNMRIPFDVDNESALQEHETDGDER